MEINPKKAIRQILEGDWYLEDDDPNMPPGSMPAYKRKYDQSSYTAWEADEIADKLASHLQNTLRSTDCTVTTYNKSRAVINIVDDDGTRLSLHIKQSPKYLISWKQGKFSRVEDDLAFRIHSALNIIEFDEQDNAELDVSDNLVIFTDRNNKDEVEWVLYLTVR